jgi:NADH-quinone oxidoreductase subunit N
LEATIKYFILGGIASCVLINGISWLFSITNTLDYFSVKFYLIHQINVNNKLELLFIITCFIFTFLFKMSAFPCHVWSPDVYEGIWTPITAYFAVVIKSVVFLFFVRIFCYVFVDLIILWQPFFLISSLGSIIIGCLGSLLQYKIKRFLAYTSINQVGFLLLGISTVSLKGIASAFLFLFIYLIMSLIFFTILLNTQHFVHKIKLVFLSDLRSLDYYNSNISLPLIITLFSMAGIPPLAGFFTKFYVLLNAISYAFYFTSFLILLTSVISAYYYLNFIKNILFEQRYFINIFYFNTFPIKFSSIITEIGILWVLTILLLSFLFIPFLLYDLPLILSLNCKYLLSCQLKN